MTSHHSFFWLRKTLGLGSPTAHTADFGCHEDPELILSCQKISAGGSPVAIFCQYVNPQRLEFVFWVIFYFMGLVKVYFLSNYGNHFGYLFVRFQEGMYSNKLQLQSNGTLIIGHLQTVSEGVHVVLWEIEIDD